MYLNIDTVSQGVSIKDCCNRDETAADVTVGTLGKKGLVEEFRRKFIDEAKALCRWRHRGRIIS